MPNKRIALLAASGFLAALCGLAGPARRNTPLPYGYGYPAPPPLVAPVPVAPYPYSSATSVTAGTTPAWNGPWLGPLRLRLPPRLWLGRRLWLERLALERTRRGRGGWGHGGGWGTAAADTSEHH